MSDSKKLRRLEARLARFEAEHAIRACMNRYMVLCDALDARTPLDELAGLFAKDAIWGRYRRKVQGTFGRLAGRAAIRAMLGKYMTEPAHFALNVHFDFRADRVARRRCRHRPAWVMQTSTRQRRSHLNAAPHGFRVQQHVWRMSHFRTENLFSRRSTPEPAQRCLAAELM